MSSINSINILQTETTWTAEHMDPDLIVIRNLSWIRISLSISHLSSSRFVKGSFLQAVEVNPALSLFCILNRSLFDKKGFLVQWRSTKIWSLVIIERLKWYLLPGFSRGKRVAFESAVCFPEVPFSRHRRFLNIEYSLQPFLCCAA